MKTGKIVGFRATWGSGIAFLLIEDTNGHVNHIPCENPPTVRTLDFMFPGFIGVGHEVDVDVILNQCVRFETDSMGVLTYFEVA